MNIKQVKLSDIKPWDENPRTVTDKNMARLKYQLTDMNQHTLLIVNQDGIILGGNMRYRAMKELGWTECYVVEVEAKTKAEMLKYAISSNDSIGCYVEEQLRDLVVAAAPNILLSNFGVQLGKMTPILNLLPAPVLVEDEVPETETFVKEGDLWKLGEHLLYCGDSTKTNDVFKLMNNEKIDLVVTDPPYNVNYSSKNEYLNLFDKGNCNQEPILGDNCITRQQYADLCNNWINTINPYLADYNSIYAFGISESVIPYYQHPELHISNTLIWVKQNAVLGRMDYNCQHEVIVYAWVGKHKFYGPTNATTVINYPKPFKSELHPTMKPVGLIAQLITNSSTEKQIVYDAFAGSGTTLIACEQLNRKCRAMELSPHYCSVIIKRWENLTQKKAEKIT